MAVSLATRPVFPPVQRARAAARARPHWAPGALILALALPPLFLHVEYQPGVSLGLGSTAVEVELSDLAILAVVGAAVVFGRRSGFLALRSGWGLWLAIAALAGWIVAATLYGPLVLDGYPLLENLVTAAKLVEYSLLAIAVPLLVRSRAVGPLLTVLVAWSALATLVGLVQFFGADVFDAWNAGLRQPSFLGHNDFAALSGSVYLLGLWRHVRGQTLVMSRWDSRLAWVAILSGGLGLVLSAAVAALVGLAPAVAVVAFLGRRALARVALALALTGTVAVGVLVLRSGDVADFLSFAQDDEAAGAPNVETYSQRTLLAYIGWRVFLDHPVAGVGWQGSSEPAAFGPHLDEARARFPDTAPLAFPSSEHRYGVQNAYVQTLADLGLVGALLLAMVFGAGLLLGVRAAIRGSPIALLWLLLALGLWGAQGLVTGIPLAALTWLALGLAASDARG